MKNDNNKLLKTGLVLTIPSAVILFVMSSLNEISTDIAISGYFSILILTLVFILPFMTDLISVTNYIKSIAKGDKNVIVPKIEANKEVKDIVKAINQLMNVWNTESTNLKAQTMTDAAVLAVLPYPLFLIDNDLNICGANLIALDIFGHNIKGKSVSRVFSENELISLIKKATESNIKEKTELLIHSKKDRYFEIVVETLPTIAKEGAVVVVAFHDITAIRKNEIMQADFIANASHELKTPLAAISGFIETLQTSAKGDEKATVEFLNIMDIQAKRMGRLIANLLCLSRLEAKETSKHDRLDISKIVDTVTKSLFKKAEAKKMVFDINLNNEIEFFGDSDEISQVIHNLVDNAIKYGKENTKIIIKSNKDEEKSVISVTNFGNIIEEKHLARLSERFYRIDSSAKSKAEGTGLGLSIVNSILKHHGAKLWVSSSEEEGTVFSVIFPKFL